MTYYAKSPFPDCPIQWWEGLAAVMGERSPWYWIGHKLRWMTPEERKAWRVAMLLGQSR